MNRSGNKKKPFLLSYHPDVRKIDLPLLDEKIKTQIRTVIEKRLQTAPQDYGEPLRKTLKGYWKLRAGNYRIVYKITGSEVLIPGIRHRCCLSENVGAVVTNKRKADLQQQGNIYT